MQTILENNIVIMTKSSFHKFFPQNFLTTLSYTYVILELHVSIDDFQPSFHPLKRWSSGPEGLRGGVAGPNVLRHCSSSLHHPRPHGYSKTNMGLSGLSYSLEVSFG